MTAAPSRNYLLAALGEAGLESIRPVLSQADLPRGHVLNAAGEQIERIWFPETGVASVRMSFPGGEGVDVATVGREGFLGHGVVLGDNLSVVDALMQVPGAVSSLPLATFQETMERVDAFRLAITRAARAFFLEVAMVAACNRLHRAERRMARWLLMTHDRVGRNELLTTHEFLSQMLGANRTTTTLALGRLQTAGLIRTAWGRVTILDRPGLELASCDCYANTRAEYARIMGPLFDPELHE